MTPGLRVSLISVFVLVAAPACSNSAGPALTPQAQVTAAKTSYLGIQPLPGGLDLVPPPPVAGSAREARDLAGAVAAIRQQSGPRWDLTAADAELAPGRAAMAFSCAAGFTIDRDLTPALVALLGRTFADLGISTSEVKKRYSRARPFMVNGQPSCTPTWDAMLRKDGSYPSGHSAIGYGFGLILAEIVPDRAAQLVARGRAYGDSRRICNVHWMSDIEEGRNVAAATVMRLNADPAFRADLDAARAEVAALRTKGPATPTTCAAEAEVLANTAAF